MKAIGIIPARMGASRFPGKPLAKMLGMPMVGHCYHRTRLAPGLDAAYVATCDDAIADYVRGIGGNVVMTAASHNRATTRTAEALELIERETGEQIDIVVMVQGDEPLISPASTTKVPKDSPLIIRLRLGKLIFSGLVKSGNSERTAPFFCIISANFLFSEG